MYFVVEFIYALVLANESCISYQSLQVDDLTFGMTKKEIFYKGNGGNG